MPDNVWTGAFGPTSIGPSPNDEAMARDVPKQSELIEVKLADGRELVGMVTTVTQVSHYTGGSGYGPDEVHDIGFAEIRIGSTVIRIGEQSIDGPPLIDEAKLGDEWVVTFSRRDQANG